MSAISRRAELSDLPELLRLEAESFSGDRLSRRSLKHLLQSSTALCLVVDDDGGRLAGYALWPFGRAVVPRDAGFFTGVGNVVWLVLIGWWLAAAHFVFGILLCVTLIGIPMGVASFRMAGLALWPFGREVVDRSTLSVLPEGSVTLDRP